MGKRKNIWRKVLESLSVITILTGIVFFVIVARSIGITARTGYSIPISIFASLLFYFLAEINLRRKTDKALSFLVVIILIYLTYSFIEVLHLV